MTRGSIGPTVLRLIDLVAATRRTMPWIPLMAAAALGVVIVAVPVTVPSELTPADHLRLLRLVAAGFAIGAAFILNDPAAETLVAVPTPWLVRSACRAFLAGAVFAGWWAVLLLLTRLGSSTDVWAATAVRRATGDAVALVTGAVALAGLARSRARRGRS